MILLNKSITASIEVHTQNTFTPLCQDELPVPEGHLIVSELNKQAQFAKYRIGSKEAHHPAAIWVAKDKNEQLSQVEGRNVDVKWVPHAIVGTKGFEAISGLPHITSYDFYVWEGIELDMHPYGICYHDLEETLTTGVIEFLKYHQVRTVLIGGLATDYCVKVSVLQLLGAGFSVIVNLAACRGLNPTTTEDAIHVMQTQGAQFIKHCDELQYE